MRWCDPADPSFIRGGEVRVEVRVEVSTPCCCVVVVGACGLLVFLTHGAYATSS